MSVLFESSIRHFLRAVRELFFPSACLVCNVILPDVEDLHICQGCLASFVMVEPPFCSCCGDIFPSAAGGNHLCSVCLTRPYYFTKARAVVSYKDPVSTLIHSFKYAGRTTAFSTFKALWGQSVVKNDLDPFDLIIPVPLHITRLRERGFNQAKLLAEIFFPDQADKIKSNILLRCKNTPHQTTLSGKERRQNLINAFDVSTKEQVIGKKVIIIDDVFTTGATLNECARVLSQAGALEIQVVTLARSFQ